MIHAFVSRLLPYLSALMVEECWGLRRSCWGRGCLLDDLEYFWENFPRVRSTIYQDVLAILPESTYHT
jgi:hypothetical protein